MLFDDKKIYLFDKMRHKSSRKFCMIEPYSEIAIHSEKKGYLLLFNALTDTEETLRQLREDLIAVQRQAEELFLSDTPQDGEIESETP